MLRNKLLCQRIDRCRACWLLWTDPEVTLARIRYAPEGTLERTATWRGEAMTAAAARGDAFVAISADDPDLFANADPVAVATVRSGARAALRGYYEYAMRNAVRMRAIATARSVPCAMVARHRMAARLVSWQSRSSSTTGSSMTFRATRAIGSCPGRWRVPPGPQ